MQFFPEQAVEILSKNGHLTVMLHSTAPLPRLEINKLKTVNTATISIFCQFALCISQFQAWSSPGRIFLIGRIPPPGTQKVPNPDPWSRKIVLKTPPQGIYF